jgi:hypothetical protein
MTPQACQYLHVCTSKASKLRTFVLAEQAASSEDRAAHPSSELQEPGACASVSICTLVPVKQVNFVPGALQDAVLPQLSSCDCADTLSQHVAAHVPARHLPRQPSSAYVSIL